MGLFELWLSKFHYLTLAGGAIGATAGIVNKYSDLARFTHGMTTMQMASNMAAEGVGGFLVGSLCGTFAPVVVPIFVVAGVAALKAKSG